MDFDELDEEATQITELVNSLYADKLAGVPTIDNSARDNSVRILFQFKGYENFDVYARLYFDEVFEDNVVDFVLALKKNDKKFTFVHTRLSDMLLKFRIKKFFQGLFSDAFIQNINKIDGNNWENIPGNDKVLTYVLMSSFPKSCITIENQELMNDDKIKMIGDSILNNTYTEAKAASIVKPHEYTLANNIRNQMNKAEQEAKVIRETSVQEIFNQIKEYINKYIPQIKYESFTDYDAIDDGTGIGGDDIEAISFSTNNMKHVKYIELALVSDQNYSKNIFNTNDGTKYIQFKIYFQKYKNSENFDDDLNLKFDMSKRKMNLMEYSFVKFTNAEFPNIVEILKTIQTEEFIHCGEFIFSKVFKKVFKQNDLLKTKMMNSFQERFVYSLFDKSFKSKKFDLLDQAGNSSMMYKIPFTIVDVSMKAAYKRYLQGDTDPDHYNDDDNEGSNE